MVPTQTHHQGWVGVSRLLLRADASRAFSGALRHLLFPACQSDHTHVTKTRPLHVADATCTSIASGVTAYLSLGSFQQGACQVLTRGGWHAA
jgi:hypothetical protein